MIWIPRSHERASMVFKQGAGDGRTLLQHMPQTEPLMYFSMCMHLSFTYSCRNVCQRRLPELDQNLKNLLLEKTWSNISRVLTTWIRRLVALESQLIPYSPANRNKAYKNGALYPRKSCHIGVWSCKSWAMEAERLVYLRIASTL
jgi:hypothetical protein